MNSVCLVCQKRFSSDEVLAAHMQALHPHAEPLQPLRAELKRAEGTEKQEKKMMGGSKLPAGSVIESSRIFSLAGLQPRPAAPEAVASAGAGTSWQEAVAMAQERANSRRGRSRHTGAARVMHDREEPGCWCWIWGGAEGGARGGRDAAAHVSEPRCCV